MKTTLSKLWNSYYYPHNKWAPLSYFIGKISYETESDIRTFFENQDNLRSLIFDGNGVGPVETLLIKRVEFKHENEIRLLYVGHEGDDLTKSIFQYGIDPFTLIDELVFDPRMDKNVFVAFQNELMRLGITAQILQSSLYKLPNFNLRL